LPEGRIADAQGSLREAASAYGGIGHRHDLGMTFALWACAARGAGEGVQARQGLCEALRIGTEIQSFRPCLYGVVTFSLLSADSGEAERAVELYALASRYGHVANSRWFEDVAGKHITAVAETLPPEAVTAAQERGRARDLWATAEELLAEVGPQRVEA
jgi:hypothetical protein